MRVIVKGSELEAAAYAGTYVVVLAWDTLDGKMPLRTDLLGYAIERAEFDVAGNEVERYWMRGIKRFKERDKGLPPGTPVSTAEHPIQSFLWADYTAKAGSHYRFGIVPLHGTVRIRTRRRGGSDARGDHRDRGRCAARRRRHPA
jgi:hypothetical protein